MKHLFLLFGILSFFKIAMGTNLNVLNKPLSICSTDPLTGI